MSNNPVTRRHMLKSSVGLFASTCLLGCQKSGRSRETAGFKLGVCDWTLGKMADPEALILAAELGLDGVQISLGTKANNMHLRQPEIRQLYRDMAEKTGMEMPSIAIGELNNVPLKNDPLAMEWLLDCIDVCESLQIKNILVPFFGEGDIRSDETGKKAVIARLKEAAPKAEKTGVRLAIESWLSADEHLRIIEAVASPSIKVYYDVANSDKAGYDIYQEIRRLGDHICEFHAKDYQDLYGKGSIRFEDVREAMETIGYRGWFVLEGNQYPLGLEESIRYDVEYLRKLFPREV